MTMNYVRFLASLKKKLKGCTAEKGKPFEVITFSIKLSSPEELIRMKRLNKINRKTCRTKKKSENSKLKYAVQTETPKLLTFNSANPDFIFE